MVNAGIQCNLSNEMTSYEDADYDDDTSEEYDPSYSPKDDYTKDDKTKYVIKICIILINIIFSSLSEPSQAWPD
jgi:hypothetical protein